MRKEDFYDVFEYGDRLEPGVELKIRENAPWGVSKRDMPLWVSKERRRAYGAG